MHNLNNTWLIHKIRAYLRVVASKNGSFSWFHYEFTVQRVKSHKKKKSHDFAGVKTLPMNRRGIGNEWDVYIIL